MAVDQLPLGTAKQTLTQTTRAKSARAVVVPALGMKPTRRQENRPEHIEGPNMIDQCEYAQCGSLHAPTHFASVCDLFDVFCCIWGRPVGPSLEIL